HGKAAGTLAIRSQIQQRHTAARSADGEHRALCHGGRAARARSHRRMTRGFRRIPQMPISRSRSIASSIIVCTSLLVSWSCSTRTYELVIANGYVMDPESGFDRVANIGITGDRIDAISDTALHGVKVIDANGLVVAPGLIELHTHGEDSLNYRYRAMDGIT